MHRELGTCILDGNGWAGEAPTDTECVSLHAGISMCCMSDL